MARNSMSPIYATLMMIIFYFIYMESSYGLESEIVDRPFDLSAFSPVLPQRVLVDGSIDEAEAVTEVTILLEGGDGTICPLNAQCLNPTVSIKAELGDLDRDDQYLDIYYGSFTTESLIGRCANHTDSDICGLYADCIESYSPPAGCYNQLTFFVYQTEDVEVQCGNADSNEGIPSRGYRLQFDIFCEAGCDTTECVENTRRRLLGAGDLVDDLDHDETSTADYDLELECKAYEDAFTGFLVFVGICWIVQCGGFYVYRNKR